jgi:hypothetical protein
MKAKTNLGICVKCKKSKATIVFANSVLDWTHGFSQNICDECYDKLMKTNEWYKKGYEDGLKEARKSK